MCHRRIKVVAEVGDRGGHLRQSIVETHRRAREIYYLGAVEGESLRPLVIEERIREGRNVTKDIRVD